MSRKVGRDVEDPVIEEQDQLSVREVSNFAYDRTDVMPRDIFGASGTSSLYTFLAVNFAPGNIDRFNFIPKPDWTMGGTVTIFLTGFAFGGAANIDIDVATKGYVVGAILPLATYSLSQQYAAAAEEMWLLQYWDTFIVEGDESAFGCRLTNNGDQAYIVAAAVEYHGDRT